MNVRELSFLTDENIDRELVGFLRTAGMDVFDIKEAGLFGISESGSLAGCCE